jgi:proline dehydrogenase
MLKRLLERPLRWALQTAGRAYVPGERLQDAVQIAESLGAQGTPCTIGYFSSNADSPEVTSRVCESIVDAVAAMQPRGYVSIKAPAFRYDPRLLAAIVLKAREADVLAHFDSHELHTADATLKCVQQAASLGGRVGMTIPGRWHRSLADAELACSLGARVRLVKGEWADPGDRGRDRRQGSMEVVECLTGRAREVAIASHDPWLVANALPRLLAAGSQCELELLYGMPMRRVVALAREFAVPVRVYIPFGIAWRPYAASRAAENPRILWWLVRDGVDGLLGRHRS